MQIDKQAPENPPFMYLIASWVVNQLVAASMQGLSSIHRVKDHFVPYHHLKKPTNTYFPLVSSGG